MNLVLVPLDSSHNTKGFKSVEPKLDAWLKRRGLSNSSEGWSRTRVLTEAGSREIVGFFCLAAGGIVQDLAKVAPGDPTFDIPAVRLGRLAIAESYMDQGYGKLLLIEAFKTAVAADAFIAWRVMVVDAKHEKAAGFYLKQGATRSADDPLCLFFSRPFVFEAVRLAAGDSRTA